MSKRPKLLQAKATATSEEQRSFNEIFERFRIAVFKKLSRNADLKKNNEILKSVFMNLYEMVNKIGDRPGLNLIEFKVSVHKLFPGFKLDEIRRLFLYFDTDRNGRITVEEFIIGIKGKLNAYRERLVQFAFHLLDTNGNGLIEENELIEYLQRTNMPKILSGTALPHQIKSKELIRSICSEDTPNNAISVADLQEFYIDRGVFTTDDLTFKNELLEDWLFSEELCDQYLENNSPNAVPSIIFESSSLAKRGDVMSRVSFSSPNSLGKSASSSYDVSASNSPRRRVYDTPLTLTSVTNNGPRTKDLSVRSRLGIASAVDGVNHDHHNSGFDKYDSSNIQHQVIEPISLSSKLKIVEQQRDILAQQANMHQYFTQQMEQSNQGLGLGPHGGSNPGLVTVPGSGLGPGLGGSGQGQGYRQQPQQSVEKNNSTRSIELLRIWDKVAGSPSGDFDVNKKSLATADANCLLPDLLQTSLKCEENFQLKIENQRALLRQQQQIMEKMKLFKDDGHHQQQHDLVQTINQTSNQTTTAQHRDVPHDVPHAPVSPRINYSFINTSMRALVNTRVNQTSPETPGVSILKENYPELNKEIEALKNELGEKNVKINQVEKLLLEYDQEKKESDRLISSQELELKNQQEIIQNQQYLIQAQQSMISKMQSMNVISYDKCNNI